MEAHGRWPGWEQTDALYAPAVRRALALFPVEADEITLIDHSENVTYRIKTPGEDPGFVLRLHRPDYNSIEELESERTWTTALGGAGMPVPESVPARGGEFFPRIEIPEADETRYAGMSRWIDGIQLSDFPMANFPASERNRIFRRIGQIAADIHNQSTAWTVPSGFERPRLDIGGLLGDNPRWGPFWEHPNLTADERELVVGTRDALRALLNNYGEMPENFSLIHADLDPDNIIVNEDELALIDFDDSAFGWHMYDVASALFEDRSASHFESVRDALLEGYRSRRSLRDSDVAMLPAFLLIRGMATMGWYYQRPEYEASVDLDAIRRWIVDQCESFAGVSGVSS